MRKNKYNTISKESWKQARKDLQRALAGKLPKGDYWITTRMPWMTDKGWKEYQKRLSEVDYTERTIEDEE
jgi:hypothetical protein